MKTLIICKYLHKIFASEKTVRLIKLIKLRYPIWAITDPIWAITDREIQTRIPWTYWLIRAWKYIKNRQFHVLARSTHEIVNDAAQN